MDHPVHESDQRRGARLVVVGYQKQTDEIGVKMLPRVSFFDAHQFWAWLLSHDRYFLYMEYGNLCDLLYTSYSTYKIIIPEYDDCVSFRYIRSRHCQTPTRHPREVHPKNTQILAGGAGFVERSRSRHLGPVFPQQINL